MRPEERRWEIRVCYMLQWWFRTAQGLVLSETINKLKTIGIPKARKEVIYGPDQFLFNHNFKDQ